MTANNTMAYGLLFLSFFAGGLAVGPAAAQTSESSPVYVRPTAQLASQAVVITAQVPADAEVWLNGRRMSQTGTARRFISPPLARDQTYAYELRVRSTQDGRAVERTRRVEFRAGDQVSVNFPANAEPTVTTTRAPGSEPVGPAVGPYFPRPPYVSGPSYVPGWESTGGTTSGVPYGISAPGTAPYGVLTPSYYPPSSAPYLPPERGPRFGTALPGTGVYPSTSGQTYGPSSPPGTGVFPSTSGYYPGPASHPGTGVFPSTSGYRGR